MKSPALILFLSAVFINTFAQGTGESRFGVHLGSLDYNSAVGYITELVEHIYVRGPVPQDEIGWYYIKNVSLIPRCTTYCDTARCPCDCTVGSYYYSNT